MTADAEEGVEGLMAPLLNRRRFSAPKRADGTGRGAGGIEGHVTHPADIERALNNDYSPDLGKRNLQLEARAHVAVQQ